MTKLYDFISNHKGKIAKGLAPLVAAGMIGCGNDNYELIGERKLAKDNSSKLYRKTENVDGVEDSLVKDSLVIRNKDGSTITFLDFSINGTLGAGYFDYVISNDSVKYPRGLLAQPLEDSLDNEYRECRSKYGDK